MQREVRGEEQHVGNKEEGGKMEGWDGKYESYWLHLLSGSEIKTTQDKFLVQTHTFPDAQTVPQLSDLPMYWKALPSASVKEHRYGWMDSYRCRVAWVAGETPSLKQLYTWEMFEVQLLMKADHPMSMI